MQSAQASEQEQLLSNPTATVAVDRLNVRSGPGTNFNRVGGGGARGDALIVTGQVNNCGWLQIVTADELEGWVSGSSQYVTLDARCADIPEVEAPSGAGRRWFGEQPGRKFGWRPGEQRQRQPGLLSLPERPRHGVDDYLHEPRQR